LAHCPDPRIVICGGGIIGAATAFYLAELGVGKDVTIVEKDEIAAAASGEVQHHEFSTS
jgi:glycine/D-amino acid oxidase-like deaminating enzyme